MVRPCVCAARFVCDDGCLVHGTGMLQVCDVTPATIASFNQRFRQFGLALNEDGQCSCTNTQQEIFQFDEELENDAEQPDGWAAAQAAAHNKIQHSSNGNTKGSKGGSSQPGKGKGKSNPPKAKIVATSQKRAAATIATNTRSNRSRKPLTTSYASSSTPLKQTVRPRPPPMSEVEIVAAHFARNFAPSTYALMEQVLDPDGPPGQSGDPRLYHVAEPVPIPLKSPTRSLTYPVMSVNNYTVPPGAFVLMQTALNTRASAGQPEDALSLSQSSPGVVMIVADPAAAIAYWSENIKTVEPYLYNVQDGIGVDSTNIEANRLSIGALNDGRVITGSGIDYNHVNALFTAGGFSGGMTAPKRTAFPDTPPLSVACAGGYQRVYATFANQLDSLRFHQVICRRGRVPPGSQSSETTNLTQGLNQYLVTADGDQFFYPSAFANFCQGVGQPAVPFPGFNVTDFASPLAGNWLVPTVLALKTMLHAISGASVFDLFKDELFPCSEAPYKTGTLVGSMEKECGYKARFPCFDSGSNGGLTEFGDYNEVVGNYYNNVDTLVPAFTQATGIASETGSVLLSYFQNTTSNNIVLDCSSVIYVTATYPSDMDVPFCPPWDPYADSAISMLATHTVFCSPDSFWNWIKKAAKSVWGAVKKIGKTAGGEVLAALPSLAAGVATGNPAMMGSALSNIATNTAGALAGSAAG